mgnify:CR=1 FL=1
MILNISSFSQYYKVDIYNPNNRFYTDPCTSFSKENSDKNQLINPNKII